MVILRPTRRNAGAGGRSVFWSLPRMEMNRYLFCVTELPAPPEAAVEETEAERREREAARLEVPAARPGDDPPTHGDEGGGSLSPEPPPRRLFLERMRLFTGRLRRRGRRGGP
jgi:hypothetical protein